MQTAECEQRAGEASEPTGLEVGGAWLGLPSADPDGMAADGAAPVQRDGDAPAAALGWALVDLAHAAHDYAAAWDGALDVRAAWLALRSCDDGPAAHWADPVCARLDARAAMARAWSAPDAAPLRDCWRVLVVAAGVAHEAADAAGVRLPCPRIRLAERWAELDGAEVRAGFGGLAGSLFVAGPSTIPAPPPALGEALTCGACGRGFMLGSHGQGDDGPRDLCPACAAEGAAAARVGLRLRRRAEGSPPVVMPLCACGCGRRGRLTGDAAREYRGGWFASHGCRERAMGANGGAS